MKKVLTILLALLIFPLTKMAGQNQNLNNLEKLNSYKIGFFTRKLNLTSEEAEKFWPAYNDYQKQKNQIQNEKLSLMRDFNQNESTLNDSQLTDMGDKLVASIVQESNLAVSFHKKLKEVLPPAKVVRFYQAENQFKLQLLNDLQGKPLQQQQRLQRRNF